MKEFQKVTVLGLGYIGLPTAALLATKGFSVQGYDVNPHVIKTINRGDVHITETDLDLMVNTAVKNSHLKAYSEPQEADVFLIAVPTPFLADHKPDLSYVKAATESLAPLLKPGNLIILESTSPVGTTEKIAGWLQDLRKDLCIPNVAVQKQEQSNDNEQIYIAHCPERVLPGRILEELVENDRIIGGIDQASSEKANRFYQCFVKGGLLVTNARTAEMAKLTENAFRDVNIAFANELSAICETLSSGNSTIDVWELIRLANRHPRVNILQPGPGVGGHCIAVDPWFIIDSAPADSDLLKTARTINDRKPERVLAKVHAACENFDNPTIACLGLAYKADIDDLRESPAMLIVERLANDCPSTLCVVEPNIDSLPEKLKSTKGKINFVDTEAAVEQADIILLLVKHKEFAAIDLELLNDKVVIDTRGLWK